MVTVTEGTFKVGDQELYTKTWLVSRQLAGLVPDRFGL